MGTIMEGKIITHRTKRGKIEEYRVNFQYEVQGKCIFSTNPFRSINTSTSNLG
jgi:hypothetical protein